MPEPDCSLGYNISATTWNLWNFTSGKSYWRCAATASRGFEMVLFTEPSEDLCLSYMRSTDCLSSCFCCDSVLLHTVHMSKSVADFWKCGAVRAQALKACRTRNETLMGGGMTACDELFCCPR